MSSLDISLEYTLKGNEKAHDCRGIIYNTPTSTFNTKQIMKIQKQIKAMFELNHNELYTILYTYHRQKWQSDLGPTH